jgi:hypothetical protein
MSGKTNQNEMSKINHRPDASKKAAGDTLCMK